MTANGGYEPPVDERLRVIEHAGEACGLDVEYVDRVVRIPFHYKRTKSQTDQTAIVVRMTHGVRGVDPASGLRKSQAQ